jgi:hypothetical protein
MKRKSVSKKQKVKKVLKKFEWKDGKHRESKPEKAIKDLLIGLNIPFHQEYRLSHKNKIKSYDFCIYEYKMGIEQLNWRLLIEVHGDYWHSLCFFEGIKKRHKLTKIQKKNLRNDILKRKICKYNQIPIIYVWENEIKNNPDLVKEKIVNSIKYIKENNKTLDIPNDIVPDYYENLTQ